MITADPQRRAAVLNEVLDILRREAPADDRDLLCSFAPIIFAEMPDLLALRLPAAALAARLHHYFTFVARTIPPETQLYRGLPGIHVKVRNPGEADAAGLGMGEVDGGPHDATIVDIHTPDAPFLFESLKNYFQRRGLRVFSAIHPIFTVHRQWERIVRIGSGNDEGARELLCEFRIERVEKKEKLHHIEHQVFSLLKSVFLAVENFPDMKRTLRELAPRLTARRGDTQELEGARAFIDWLLDENYVLFGMLRYHIGEDGRPHPDQEAALGAFKDPALLPVVFPGLVEQARATLVPQDGDDRVVDIDYSVRAYAIHHLEPIDDVVIREWGPDGDFTGATVLFGRLAKGALAERAQDIPMLKEKLATLLALLGARPNSHAFRETRAIFNHFPKRELFYASTGDLKRIIDQMVHMASDDEIIVTTRQGAGYAAALVAFSELRYSHKTEEDLKLALADRFGPISFNTWADCGNNVVLVFYFDAATLEHPLEAEKAKEIAARTITSWEDQVAHEMDVAFGPLEGRQLLRKYVRTESRSGLYRETAEPREVPEDVRRLESLEARLEMTVLQESPERVCLKLFSPTPLGLTETLRTLQHLGLKVVDELGIPLVLPEGRKGFMERFKIEVTPKLAAAVLKNEEGLLDALRALHEGRATDCPLNGLILLEGLGWRQVDILRTLRNHLLQIRPHYNSDTINSVLLRNSRVAAALFREFAARFDPALRPQREEAMEQREDEVNRALGKVASLREDEILRAFHNLICAMVRTNFYQTPERPVISIKVESARVEGMPSPRPLYEIYVHSPLLEGIHLRGGKVARGGIRWSDRHDDFRTEILGLMKTQMLKNSIIVPVGSKGGFVLKGNVPQRPALDAYLTNRYRQFISGLLDVTDNIVDGEVMHPPDVVRHDDDDPYLVVAADKGTAHLSDTANEVSAQYGFWLGDAFASGGSHGYDHKEEGITARGAWECIRHHFRNLGHDIQEQPFTCVGIGDMSGDVFGNAMRLSRATKLVAAFNHRHIFIDPDPDPEKSFAERDRLFGLPRSAWTDYDASLISEGGGIFDRSAKSIPISPQMQTLLGITASEASGEEVIRHILKAKVDLLYNGGIGTYIKASTEDDVEVGDRANDLVRVDGAEVQARVLGEGGNVGVTQKGRIEYWGRGGLCNTDAIDNSGGVDMSDHEVNIKILLSLLTRNGVIGSRDERNRMLEGMTDEVSELVLADNRHQAVAITLDGLRSAQGYEEFLDAIDHLVGLQVLSRENEDLPSRDELLASPTRDRGIPRPIRAILLGYTKIWAYTEVLHAAWVDTEIGLPLLERYFPRRLRESAREYFPTHPLRREIVATVAANHVVNHAGVSFLPRAARTTDADVGEIVAAYLEVDRELEADTERQQLLESGLSLNEELAKLLEIEERLEAGVQERVKVRGPKLEAQIST
jgi:glutamate dehydrogenase